MPRGYVRTGKNADPEFRKVRAQRAAAARHGIEPALRKVLAAAGCGELTKEQMSLLLAALDAK